MQRSKCETVATLMSGFTLVRECFYLCTNLKTYVRVLSLVETLVAVVVPTWRLIRAN